MPIPSSKWFPTSLQAQAAWYFNFVEVFTPIGVGLGFTPAEVTAFQDDQADLAAIAQLQESLDNASAAFRQFRISVTEDPVGTPQPVFPSLTWNAPANGVEAGMFQRLISAVDRIRAHPTYTDEMGANLGIKPSASGPSPETVVKPSIKLTAVPGNVVEAKFVRGSNDGVRIEMQIDIDTNWTVAGNFPKSPAVINIPAGPDNLPRAIRMRARYLDGNNPVGENSDTVNVTTTP